MQRVVPPARASGADAVLAHPVVKPVLFLVCLLPFLQLAYGAAADALGPNPAESVIRGSGDWALRLLCATLAVTPLRVLLGLPVLARWRRMLGLFAFFYATLHALAYGWLDMGLSLPAIAHDIAARPFILAGVVTFGLLFALAVTSPRRVVRRLGGRRWQRLHHLIYVAAPLAVLHFYWMRATKYDMREVAIYAAVMAALLLWRLARRLRRSNRDQPLH